MQFQHLVAADKIELNYHVYLLDLYGRTLAVALAGRSCTCPYPGLLRRYP